MRNLLVAFFSTLAVVALLGLVVRVYGQPVKVVPAQPALSASPKEEAPAFSLVHYRCEKDNGNNFRFIPIDCDSCLVLKLTCVNCSCGDEK